MKLLIGLGNPGQTYSNNRHNIGFMALDAVHQYFSFPPWRSKFSAYIAKGTIDGHDILLIKPQTFMNLSGQSIGEAARFHKISSNDIIVFHDELDLAAGKIRHKFGGGVAGHNGLKSTRAHIGENFHRIRLGIGHPGRKELVNNWVLGDFAKKDQEDWLDELLKAIPQSLPLLFDKGEERFVSDIARRLNPNEKQSSQAKNQQSQKAQNQKQHLDNIAQNAPKPQNHSKENQSPFSRLKNIFDQEN